MMPCDEQALAQARELARAQRDPNSEDFVDLIPESVDESILKQALERLWTALGVESPLAKAKQ